MAGAPQFSRSEARNILNDIHHMMRCKNYNGNEGIICREVTGRGQAGVVPTGKAVIIRESG
jgi:hypothetical protein